VKLVAGKPGDLCVDVDESLDAAHCQLMVAGGVKGVWRYLSDVKAVEAATITTSGLILYFVNHSRSPGWIPSAADGAADAKTDIANLQRLGIPAGVHMFFDLEGVGGGSPTNLIAHLDAYASAIKTAGYIPAVYVGAQSLLTSAQLYDLGFTLYWHGASHVEDITGAEAGPKCGWSIYQGSIVDIPMFGVTIDWNFIGGDFYDRLPVGVAA
jgi:hypothetical protein